MGRWVCGHQAGLQGVGEGLGLLESGWGRGTASSWCLSGTSVSLSMASQWPQWEELQGAKAGGGGGGMDGGGWQGRSGWAWSWGPG